MPTRKSSWAAGGSRSRRCALTYSGVGRGGARFLAAGGAGTTRRVLEARARRLAPPLARRSRSLRRGWNAGSPRLPEELPARSARAREAHRHHAVFHAARRVSDRALRAGTARMTSSSARRWPTATNRRRGRRWAISPAVVPLRGQVDSRSDVCRESARRARSRIGRLRARDAICGTGARPWRGAGARAPSGFRRAVCAAKPSGARRLAADDLSAAADALHRHRAVPPGLRNHGAGRGDGSCLAVAAHAIF